MSILRNNKRRSDALVPLHGEGSTKGFSTSRFGMRCVHRFGFRRPSLSKEYGEPHHRRDGEEFALPVLKRLEPETRRGDVIGERRLRLMMQDFAVAYSEKPPVRGH